MEHRDLPAGSFGLVSLVSDVPGLAGTIDPNLVNPWGLAFSPTGPFWLADNGSGVSGIADGRGGQFALVVTSPSGSAPTGVVFNGGPGFAISENGLTAPSRFLFGTEAGTIVGWSAVVDPTHALLAVDNSASGAVYTGVALAADGAGGRLLYAADFGRATIDVFDQRFQPVIPPGSFQDPTIPDDFAPFNIQNIDDLLFVTYAQQDADGHDDVPGAGHGYIDVYNPDGSLLRRFASQGPLDSPWGLALAPSGFGPLGGDLLVGNNGDGHISAYDPQSGAFLGQLAGDSGAPIVFPYLWSLTFGNGHVGGDSATLFFTAGVDDSRHGLFGAIQAPARRGMDTAGDGVFDPHAPGEPGDYPLPPRAGPALPAGSDAHPNPVVDFLPLAQSSLVLVPTLSAAALGVTGLDAAIPATIADATVLPVGDASPQSGRDADSNVVALSALLDLNAAQAGPPTRGEQRLRTNQRPVAARGTPAADRNVGADLLLSEGDTVLVAAEACEEQTARLLPASAQVKAAPCPRALTGHVEPAAEGADPHAHVKSRRPGTCTWLAVLVTLISSPVVWLYWGRRDTRDAGTCAACPGVGYFNKANSRASSSFPSLTTWRRR